MPNRNWPWAPPMLAALGLAFWTLLTSFAATAAASPAAPACHPDVEKGTLPLWARGGFHPPTTRIAHVLGRSGEIVAILFAYPLQTPPPVTHSNKILWVSRLPVNSLTNLRIDARRLNGTRPLGKPVQRIVRGGPGPSIINLPRAGCWRLSLHWADHSDSLDLQYRRRG